MSLLERSIGANEAVRQVVPTGEESFAQLKSQVLESLGALDIAELSRSNPTQARNEVRAACRRVFAGNEWAAVGEATEERLCEAVLDSMFGYGPLESLLADDEVTEIMVNAPDRVFVERAGVLYRSDLRFVDNNQIRTVIDRIIGPLGRRVDELSPMVDARLPQGHRVNAIIPPISPDGPVLTIRKFSERVMELGDLVTAGTMPPAVATLLEWAVRARKDIAVSGGTGAGKTTLLNALSCCIPHEERVVTIEDSAELRFLQHPHVVRLEARQANAEGLGRVSIRELLINALRMRPDRIVVGECRGEEALDMLQAMNTGHEGSLTTLHANSVRDVISRLSTMVRYSADIPVEVVEAYVARAFKLVVQMTRGVDGRRVVSEVAAMSYDEGRRVPVIEQVYRGGAWECAPAWVDELPGLGIAGSEEVAAWKAEVLA